MWHTSPCSSVMLRIQHWYNRFQRLSLTSTSQVSKKSKPQSSDFRVHDISMTLAPPVVHLLPRLEVPQTQAQQTGTSLRRLLSLQVYAPLQHSKSQLALHSCQPPLASVAWPQLPPPDPVQRIQYVEAFRMKTYHDG